VENRYRNELKFLCTEHQLRMIEAKIRDICRKDPYVDECGMYTVRSVYFDDLENSFYFENVNGIDPREKYRIRIYNGNAERITLECKQKKLGKNIKLSCPLEIGLLEAMLNGTLSWGDVISRTRSEAEQVVLNKFFLNYQTRLMRPKVIVEYERTPYIYTVGNVRITFDRNISGSKDTLNFLSELSHKVPVLPTGTHVLEVKYDGILPDYIYNAVQIDNLRQTAFSKYQICRNVCG